MKRTILIALSLLALSPATATAQRTLTIREARQFIEEGNERFDEKHGTESEVKRCYRVWRLQVDCHDETYLAGEPQFEILDRVYVSHGRLRDSPVLLETF